jgi:hypothetical protein
MEKPKAASRQSYALVERDPAAYAVQEELLHPVLCLRLLVLSSWIEEYPTLRP